MLVLGLGGSGHDWSSCATDGTRLAAVDEERVVRKKYGVGTDLLAARSRHAVLGEFGDAAREITHVVACELVPRPFYFPFRNRTFVINHHLAHAYSAFGASGFTEAAVLVCDNSGSLVAGSRDTGDHKAAETISFFTADTGGIRLLDRVAGTHRIDSGTESGYYQPGSTDNSLGHFYRTASLAIGLSYTGYHGAYPVSEDGKTMGLAPYGDARFVDEVAALVDLTPDGGVRIDANHVERVLTRLAEGADFESRAALAFAAQETLERAMLHCARALQRRTGATDLCLAGGVALNSVANGRILRETPFKRIFIVPAAGDNGISLGSAYYGLHELAGVPMSELPGIENSYLGPEYPGERIDRAIEASGLPVVGDGDLPGRVAGLLAEGKIVGWFDGRSEFGPRALGHRSILAAPFPGSVRDHLNENVKFREWFRPYAPVVQAEYAGEYFDVDPPAPYMLVVCRVRRPELIPAVTHVDGTARVQTLDRAANPLLHELLGAFGAISGYPVLLNTSFNVAGQPIVETPEEALEAFAKMPLDYLVLNGRLVGRP